MNDQTETLNLELCSNEVHVWIYVSKTGMSEKPSDEALCFCKVHSWGEFKDSADFHKWGDFGDLFNAGE